MTQACTTGAHQFSARALQENGEVGCMGEQEYEAKEACRRDAARVSATKRPQEHESSQNSSSIIWFSDYSGPSRAVRRAGSERIGNVLLRCCLNRNTVCIQRVELQCTTSYDFRTSAIRSTERGRQHHQHVFCHAY